MIPAAAQNLANDTDTVLLISEVLVTAPFSWFSAIEIF